MRFYLNRESGIWTKSGFSHKTSRNNVIVSYWAIKICIRCVIQNVRDHYCDTCFGVLYTLLVISVMQRFVCEFPSFYLAQTRLEIKPSTRFWAGCQLASETFSGTFFCWQLVGDLVVDLVSDQTDLMQGLRPHQARSISNTRTGFLFWRKKRSLQ